ncbi:Aspartic protease 8 [Globisporangium polare]
MAWSYRATTTTAAALLLLLSLSTSSNTAEASVVQQKLFGLSSGLAYYIQVNIGQPLYSASTANTATNQFNLLVDTGSANTAVVTADCCSLSNTALYSCSSSSTCANKGTSVSVSYITGSWSGEQVEDTFSGSSLGVVTGVPFVEIQQESNFIQSGYDGIVGLGYKAIASPSSSPPTPYFDKLQSAKSLDNVFSMLMCGSLQALSLANSSSLDTENDLYSGELILGGTSGSNGESYHKGDLVYTPLVQKKWYNVVVTDIKVSNTSLGLDCKKINTPRSIVDSGTSNIAFPSDVYSAVIAQLKTDVRKVLPSATDSFFSDEVTCCSSICDPTDAKSKIYSLPPLSISLAVDGKSEQITISIPPEYIWRPILVSSTSGTTRNCRVFGISEGEITLLGDVFMDGLFTVHDRANDQLGFGVAKSCPNGVTSSKTVTVEALSGSSLCDCVSDSDKKSSLLSSYFPIGSGKPCFFWQWWMYVVIASVVLILICIGVIFYISWRRRKLLKELHSIQSQQRNQNTPPIQRTGSSGSGLAAHHTTRQVSDGLERNLLTPTAAMQDHHDSVAPTMSIAIHNNTSSGHSSRSSSSLHSASRSSSGQHLSGKNSINGGSSSSLSSLDGGYRPPSAPTRAAVTKGDDSLV